MPPELIPVTPQPLARAGLDAVPALFATAGKRASVRLIEFFTAEIRNKNTRIAYGNAVRRFSSWCERQGLRLEQLTPIHIAAYIEQVGQGEKMLAKPSVKQHLAALRMLFDYLVLGQIIPYNPATSVRGPKYVIKKGKTPVLTEEEARQLFAVINDRIAANAANNESPSLVDLRDRALIGVMVYTFARIGAVLGMSVKDYYQQGKRWWIRLHEKGGKHHEVPAHHKAEEYLDAYLAAAGLYSESDAPLFPSVDRHRQLSCRPLYAREALAMIKRRARAAGLGATTCNHSFRATGLTNYLEHGGKLEKAPADRRPRITPHHETLRPHQRSAHPRRDREDSNLIMIRCALPVAASAHCLFHVS
jgi:integrase/recombinase XerD